jgi:hypothetical protein
MDRGPVSPLRAVRRQVTPFPYPRGRIHDTRAFPTRAGTPRHAGNRGDSCGQHRPRAAATGQVGVEAKPMIDPSGSPVYWL